MLVLLLGSWLLVGAPAGEAATVLVLAVVGIVPVLAVLADLVRKPVDLPLLAHLRMTTKAAAKQLAHFLFTLVFLPYEAAGVMASLGGIRELLVPPSK